MTEKQLKKQLNTQLQEYKVMEKEAKSGKMLKGMNAEPAVALAEGPDYTAGLASDADCDEFKTEITDGGLSFEAKQQKKKKGGKKRKPGSETGEDEARSSARGWGTEKQITITRGWDASVARKFGLVVNDLMTLRFQNSSFADDFTGKASRVFAEGSGTQNHRLSRPKVWKVFVSLCQKHGLTAAEIVGLKVPVSSATRHLTVLPGLRFHTWSCCAAEGRVHRPARRSDRDPPHHRGGVHVREDEGRGEVPL